MSFVIAIKNEMWPVAAAAEERAFLGSLPHLQLIPTIPRPMRAFLQLGTLIEDFKG